MDYQIQRGLLNAFLRVISVNRAYDARKEYVNTPLIIPTLCQSMIQRSSSTLICGLRAFANAEGEGAKIITLFNEMVDDTQEHLFDPLHEDERTRFFEDILNEIAIGGMGQGHVDPYRMALTSGRVAEDYLADFLSACHRKFFDQEEAFLNLMLYHQAGYDSNHFMDYTNYQNSVINLYDVIPDENFSEQFKNRLLQYLSSD